MPGSEHHVAGAEITVAGAALDADLMTGVTEVRVRDSLQQPAWALVRIEDPKATHMDSHPMNIGSEIEIKLTPTGSQAKTSVFKGEVVALEPEFGRDGPVIQVRAYDKSHRLIRGTKTKVYRQQKASDMVRAVASGAGLSGSVDDSRDVHEFFVQRSETDRDFIRRLELHTDFVFTMKDGQYSFKRGTAAGAAAIDLHYTQELLSFRPRISGAQQVDSVTVKGWDPDQKQAIVATQSNGAAPAELGMQLNGLVSARGSAPTLTLVDRTVTTQNEAASVATGAVDRLAATAVEAEGVCYGNPNVRAGTKLNIQNVGTKLSGKYHVTSATHIYNGSGYKTQFTVSGRSDRGLLDMMRPPAPRAWGAGLVIGIVTNNQDPEKMGRVKVKFPVLTEDGGQPVESDWARVLTPSAGTARGIWMTPQVDEEVVCGFENDDARRPFVIGSLFNGRTKPIDDLRQNDDGSFAVVSTEKGFVHTAKDLTFKSDQKMIIEVTNDQTNKVDGKQQETIQGDFTHETKATGSLKSGTSYTIEAGSSMTIKGVSISIEAQGSLSLKGATVSIEAQTQATLKGAMVDVEGSGMTNVKGGIVNLG